MTGELTAPSERACERCGRREYWDETASTWRIAAEDGDRSVGDPYCIHEWDITGKFVPFED